MCLHIVFRACWEYVVKNLDRVAWILLVDDRILNVETWDLATDAVFLDESLFVRGGCVLVCSILEDAKDFLADLIFDCVLPGLSIGLTGGPRAS